MKKQKTLIWVLAVLLAVSLFLNGWLLSEVLNRQSETMPENAPTNNNCVPFELGSSVGECISNCKSADCEINYRGGCTWCKPWCEMHFNPELPSGDYLCYCNDCRVDKSTNTLRCNCLTRHGIREASLDLNTCSGDGRHIHVMYHEGFFHC